MLRTLRLLLTALAVCAFPQDADRPIDATARHHVVEEVAGKLTALYVYPDVGAKIAAFIRRKDRQGAYDSINSSRSFAEKLTSDLQSVNHDRHLRLLYDSGSAAGTPGAPEEMRDRMRRLNFGFETARWLPGNVGYLELRAFAPRRDVQDTAAAAMAFLVNTDALIVDLRRNGGGDPSGVAFLCSYLFGDKPVHLNDLLWRGTNGPEQFWTDPNVPGRRYGPEKPVYVLTSHFTFSGAEEFAYDLQQLKRARIIGEVTGGGAHPGRAHPVGGFFNLFVPSGRALNPVSKKDWEGTGVIPEVRTTAGDALRTAHTAALRELLRKTSDPRQKRVLTDALAHTGNL